ncbi:MAG: hypothetical protein ACLQBX_15865 [Candidatus Limnocylindrales bacterium]
MARVRPFRQPFVLPAANLTGDSTQVGDGPPAGFVDNVTIAFPGAPVTASFKLLISGIWCGSWNGPTPYGPFLVCNNESIEVDATGLAPGVQYPGLWVGTRVPADQVSASAPMFGPTSVLVGNLPGSVLAGSAQQFLAVSASVIPFSNNQLYPLNGFAYPSGLTAQNFHSAFVDVIGTAGHISGTVGIYDGDGQLIYALPLVPNVCFPNQATVILPIAIGILGGANATIAVANSDTADAITVDITLSQEPFEPSIGSAPGAIDTLGRAILSPGKASARTSQSPGTASSSVQFGPATAQVAKWWQLWISIYTLNCTAIGSLVLGLIDMASGLNIAEAELILPLTANFPPAGLQVQLAGPCDFPGAAIAGGIYKLTWTHTETASVCTGRIGALVGYQ